MWHWYLRTFQRGWGSTETQNHRSITLDCRAGLHVKRVVVKQMFKWREWKLGSGSWVFIAQLHFVDFLMLCAGWLGHIFVGMALFYIHTNESMIMRFEEEVLEML